MKSIMLFLTCAFLLLVESPLVFGESMSEVESLKTMHALIAPNPFVISAEKVKEITKYYGINKDELMQKLVPLAGSYARPPISNYKVGAVVLGKSGTIYLGVNLEFLGVPLNESVHAEQFAITNARHHGETELMVIALSAAPCGHCRQFINEMGEGGTLKTITPNSSAVPISSLLPNSFGPHDLGLSGSLLTPVSGYKPLSTALTEKAHEAAVDSYAPYSNAKSGVAIRTKDGKIYVGSYLENAAFNPSLSPLQAALVALVADMRDYSEMSEVVLVEQRSAMISQETMTREILRNIGPQITVHVEKLDL